MQTLDHLLSALHGLRESGYLPPSCLSRHWEASPLPEGMIQSEPYDLAAVSMPPEMYDVAEESREAGEGQTGGLTFFAEDVSSSSSNHSLC